ncbi:MAG: hypothetical protein LBS72_07180 [Oscillospiraceae bacterium]|jgi:peptidoglycan glycosyltransferase|nr:hypothetical protein [Oscillospiraceae bacterium]
MKQLRKSVRVTTAILALMFISIGIYFPYSVYFFGGRWFARQYNPLIKYPGAVIRGDILDRKQTVLATTVDGNRAYAADESIRLAVAHVLGDEARNVKSGVETFMASYLLGLNTNFITKIAQAFSIEPRRGDDVFLTIDAELTAYIAGLFPSGAKGAAVMIDYSTGQIRALTSLPSFDLTRGASGLTGDVLLNRATGRLYAPGSVFKVITYAAALENIPNAAELEFMCTGFLPVENSTIVEAGGATHGLVDIRRAFELSCNTTFSALALDLNYNNIEKTARAFGFNEKTLFRDLMMEDGIYPVSHPDRGLDNLAQSGIGQGSVQTTPLQMALAACAIANGGVMMEPRLLWFAKQPNQGNFPLGSSIYKRVMSSQNAAIIKDAMIGAVQDGTASRFAIPGYVVGGKTGSAETSEDKSVPTHSWFIGFIDDMNHPLAICVLVENGGAGSLVAAPIAQQAMVEALRLGY